MQQEIYNQYRNIIKQNLEKCRADFQTIITKMEQSNAKYKGKTVHFLYHPMFFEPKDVEQFHSICSTMMQINQKCVAEYIKNPEFRDYFGFSKAMEDLILIDPGYSCPAPIARLDIFYDGTFSFCELNGDGSSAMNEANTLERIFLEADIIKTLQETYQISNHELFHSWLNELLLLYKEFGGIKKPTIAIVDFLGLGTVEEFKTFRTIFESRGYKTVICDPRDLIYQQGKLFYDDLQIDLVYRRAVNHEMEKRLEEIPDFIQAYRDKAVCVVGPFRSQIMHNKIFFSILCDESKSGFLTTEERDFVSQHIPYTCQIDEQSLQTALAEKDSYLIKPKDLYGGKGVICGLDCNDQEWQQALEDANYNDNYLLQEFSNFTRRNLPVFENGNFVFKPFKTTLGLFVYNEKFQGLFSRVSEHNIIAGMERSISLPSLIVEKK